MTNKVTQVILAGAGAVAALVLFSCAHLGPQPTRRPAEWSGARFVNVDDGGVNDNGQTSGVIFTQNARTRAPRAGRT